MVVLPPTLSTLTMQCTFQWTSSWLLRRGKFIKFRNCKSNFPFRSQTKRHTINQQPKMKTICNLQGQSPMNLLAIFWHLLTLFYTEDHFFLSSLTKWRRNAKAHGVALQLLPPSFCKMLKMILFWMKEGNKNQKTASFFSTTRAPPTKLFIFLQSSEGNKSPYLMRRRKELSLFLARNKIPNFSPIY